MPKVQVLHVVGRSPTNEDERSVGFSLDSRPQRERWNRGYVGWIRLAQPAPDVFYLNARSITRGWCEANSFFFFFFEVLYKQLAINACKLSMHVYIYTCK